MSLSVLFLGGAGLIGSAAAAEVVRSGAELTIVTRGEPRRSLPAQVRAVRGDVHDHDRMRELLGSQGFDVVVNWVGYNPDRIRNDVDLYSGSVGQYVFVSTCSVFARPVPRLPIVESSPRRQPHFGYARDKIACEDVLLAAYRDAGFPVTVVRPFHTYDRTVVPLLAGWTAVERMRSAAPVIVQGDGTSLWSLTHSSDVARALAPLLGDGQAIGESVNVVGGDIQTWDQVHLELARAARVPEPQLVHVSSRDIGTEIPGWADVLEYDFRHSMLFDTGRLRTLVPGFAPQVSLSQGLREVIEYYDGDPARRRVDENLNAAFDRLAAARR